MSNLSIYQNREAAQLFLFTKIKKEFQKKYSFPTLIMTPQGQLGWYLYAGGKSYTSYAKGEVEIKACSRRNPITTIVPGSYFLYQGNVWLYEDKSSRKWICFQTVVSLEMLAELNNFTYQPYMAVSRKTGKISNCFWIARVGKSNRMRDIQAVFQRERLDYNSSTHKLVPLQQWDDFELQGGIWHVVITRGQLAFSCKKKK